MSSLPQMIESYLAAYRALAVGEDLAPMIGPARLRGAQAVLEI